MIKLVMFSKQNFYPVHYTLWAHFCACHDLPLPVPTTTGPGALSSLHCLQFPLAAASLFIPFASQQILQSDQDDQGVNRSVCSRLEALQGQVSSVSLNSTAPSQGGKSSNGYFPSTNITTCAILPHNTSTLVKFQKKES